MNKPMRKVAIVIGVLFIAMFLNLNWVQVVKGKDYRNHANNQRVLLNEYSSPRGQIITADGTPIALSKKTGDELKYLRVYPHGPEYADLTGYYSFIYGTSGIERAENNLLSGDDSRLFTSRLSDILTGRNPQGGTVQLTVNAAAQQAAYNALKNPNGTFKSGAVVALDPTTGAILAAVSTPSYDPNLLASHDSDKIQKAWTALNKNSSRGPLINNAFSNVYPLGSVFKVIDSAAAISKNPDLTADTRIDAPNSYWPDSPGHTAACPANPSKATLNTYGPCMENFAGETCQNGKTATLKFALAKSCNTAFAKLVDEQVGGDALAAQAKKFGLEAPYPDNAPPTDRCDPPAYQVPLTVCRSYPGSVSDLQVADSLAQTAIGQKDVTVTPLQVAMISAAVADDGELMKPYLVNKELAPDLSTLDTTQPTQLGEAVSSSTAQTLQEMMHEVVSSPEGTGTSANIISINNKPVMVGGKTGTADHCATADTSKCPPADAWFSGFAMMNGAPKIAVAVFIANGGTNGNEVTGGEAAGPVAKAVMQAYLQQPS